MNHPPVNGMPSITIRRSADGALAATGDLNCALGHRIASSDAGPDGCGDDGIYAGWTWSAGQLTLHNDRYGLYPLFATYHS